MPAIEIRKLSGEVERRELSQEQPLSIGCHSTNDVCIDEDMVGAMHCRIRRGRKTFEIDAAMPDGVEVNGTMVRNAALTDGDVVRVGTVDIVFVNESSVSESASEEDDNQAGPGDSIPLKPISEDEISPVTYKPISREPKPAQQPATTGDDARDGRDDNGGAAVAEESHVERIDDDLYAELAESHEDEEDGGLLLGRSGAADRPKRPSDETPQPLAQRLKSLFRSGPVRPGEQDLLRSPVVIALGTTVTVLLLVSLIIWLIIGRQSSEQIFTSAEADMQSGKYIQAIDGYNEFLKLFPRHELVETVRFQRGKAQIEMRIRGARPDWSAGLEQLNSFIDDHRDLEGFQAERPNVLKYAQEIAFGAAKTAERDRRRSLLEIVDGAKSLIARFSPPDEPPDELFQQIGAARDAAVKAIRKQETFDRAVAGIQQALENRQPLAALDLRRGLLEQYAGLRSDKRLAGLLAQTLETETSLIVREDLDSQAVTSPRPASVGPPLSLTPSTPIPEDDGRVVVAVAKGCCYGIHSVTGDPLWRRVIGMDVAFFPVDVPTATPGLLVFDSRYDELILVEQQTGRDVWRQRLSGMPGGPPLVHGGQVYVATRSGHFYKIDLETGRATARLRLTQPMLGPPVLIAGGRSLVVAGERSLLYEFSLQPFACRWITHVEHKAGTVAAPLLGWPGLGSLLLMAENRRANRCRLRVFDAEQGGGPLRQIDEAEVEGQVFDPPAVRGKQLFVPSRQRQRVTAFTVSDDPNQKALTQVAVQQLQNSYDGPMFLSAGADGQLWMATNSLRRLELRSGALRLDPKLLAAGWATQPLQQFGRGLYVGRRRPYCRAVMFSKINREEMQGRWRTVLGATLLLWVKATDTSLLCLSENGDVIRVTGQEVRRGGFELDSVQQIEPAEGLETPLRAVVLADGRIAVDSAGPDPRLWLLNRIGQIEQEFQPVSPLEAPPTLLGNRMVLPVAGKLQLRSATGQTVDAFLAPVVNARGQQQQPSWRHVAALDDRHLIAADSQGQLRRLQLRTDEDLHLFEIAKLQLDESPRHDVLVRDGRLVLVSPSHTLQVLDGSTLEPAASVELDAPITAGPWFEDNRVFVEVNRKRLAGFQWPDLQTRWQATLDPLAHGRRGDPAGGFCPPKRFGDDLIVAARDGNVWKLDPQSGSIRDNPLSIGQPLHLAPMKLGETIVVPSVDGSIYQLNPAEAD